MAFGEQRDRVHQGLGRARRRVHRYTLWRWIVGVTFTCLVALLPVLGVIRFDLWGGRHVVGGEEMDLVAAAKPFAFPFLAVNVLIVLTSRFLGRWLCGFVCPVGAVSRMAEWLSARTSGPRRLVGNLGLGAFCALLAAIVFSYWIDWRVFLDGSTTARAIAGGALVVTTAISFVAARRVGLRFCKDWCPSGVYFALLGPESGTGVELAHPEACTDCGACDAVCPMDLPPRELLDGEPREAAGLYPDRMSHLSLCIRCGDCVMACESTTARTADPTPLRLGPVDRAQRAEDDEELASSTGTR